MASTIRRVVAGVGAVGLLALGVQLFGQTSASAHDNTITGQAACAANGTFTVTWTVTNGYPGADIVSMNSVSPAGTTLTPLMLHLTSSGTKGSSDTMTQYDVLANAGQAVIKLDGVWPDPNDHWTSTDTGTLTLPAGGCLPGKTPSAPTYAQPTCSAPTPTLTIPTDAGVSYTVNTVSRAAGTYPVVSGVAYHIVATSTQFTLQQPSTWDWTPDAAPTNCTTTVVPVNPTITQAACVNHSQTAPTITLPSNSAGLTYSVTPGTGPKGTYVVGDHPVVTATPTAGHVLGALTGDWTTSGDKATLTVTFLPAKDCNDTTVPVTPTVTQTTCVNHTPTTPTLTFVPTTGVSYKVTKGSVVPGGSVQVTATAAKGYEFGTLPGTWTKVDSTTATTTVQFAEAKNCGTAATPVAPSVTQAACTAGSTTPTAPTLTLVSTPGLSYTVDKAAPYRTGETVVVTATAGTNHYLSGPTSGWKLVSDTVATRTITFAAAPADCTLDVTATKAGFTAAQCVSGTPTTATYTIPKTTGVVYQVNGKPTAAGTYSAAAGTTVTVVAVPKAHYTLSGQTVWRQVFGDTPQCSGNDNQTAHKPAGDTASNSTNGSGPLATTGTPTSSLLGVGLGLLVLGGLLTVVATRRRSPRDH